MPRILVVEDNDSNRDLLTRYLELFGYEVTSAADGIEGLRTIQQDHEHLDIVLLDMSLPGMDGMEITRRLKADDATRSLPVIAITAHAMVGDRERALEAGCDDYTTKPVDFKILMNKIESLCKKAHVQ
jgi:CheY-like chemotaxis protein